MLWGGVGGGCWEVEKQRQDVRDEMRTGAILFEDQPSIASSAVLFQLYKTGSAEQLPFYRDDFLEKTQDRLAPYRTSEIL